MSDLITFTEFLLLFLSDTMDSINSPAIEQPEDIPLYPGSSQFGRRPFLSIFRQSRDVLASIIACIGAMSMGFSLGYSSPVLRQGTAIFDILDSEENQSWFGSLLPLGAMVGGPFGAVIVNRLGRKLSLIVANVPLAVGWFMIIFGSNVALLLCGRSVFFKKISPLVLNPKRH